MSARARALSGCLFLYFLATSPAALHGADASDTPTSGITPPAPAPAETPKGRFSFDLATNLSFGEGREYVYVNSIIGSELLWPLMPSAGAGLALDWEAPTGFTFRAAVDAGLPGWTGTMTDRDWMNVFQTPTVTSDDWLTNYSQHDNILMESVDLEGSLGWTFAVPGKEDAPTRPRLSLEAGFRYRWLHWEARDGYTQYASTSGTTYEEWDDSIPKTAISGTGIIYRQEWLMPFARLALAWQAGERVELSLNAALYPWLSCTGVDDHILRNARFFDYTSGGAAVEIGGGVSVQTGRHTSLFIDAKYLHTNILRGDTVKYLLSDLSYAGTYRLEDGDGGGAAFQGLNLHMGLRLRR